MKVVICNVKHEQTGARCGLFTSHVGSHEGWGTWATGLSGWIRWW